ncbi:putative disease resistance RPP13-like protein 1 [Rosa chinensis]|uniref:putative disease resistance RPP13-like protein 1 n=1 Tax=Rosa chinensis TaxID=74649 RepID=UPI000D08B6E6|nr:putative disease resistance RPP13-like protein 1 [Rosa chinensis]
MVAEVFLGAFLQLLLDRLTPHHDLLNLARLHGVDKKLKKWSPALSAIGAVLQDAEDKQLKSEAVKLWLDELKHLAFDMDDILDTFSTELLRRNVMNQQHAWLTSKVRGAKFNFNMNSEIKEISDRLVEISERKDLLGLNYVVNKCSQVWQRPPSSCVLDGPVVGRDDDKRKIVEVLLRDDQPSSVNFHVVAIVGMPGLGKTTIAGHVFNDDAMERFSPKVWVSVSDNFNLVRVTKAILESVTSARCDLEEFSQIQEILSKALASKKFLVVLDDVWNTCDYDLWAKLQSAFRGGALGSKVIVTTRDTQVAKMMRSIEVHNLGCMSDDDCWEVFGQHAFLNVENGRLQSFELFREKVVAKCGGLPLAARVLGGLLGCKEIDEWEEILNSKLWSLCDNSGILPVLKLSYHYLSSNLKRCFAYCSILPNDYEFGERQLILLWMAEGLIQQSHECKQLEDLGSNYFRELLSRSLFQRSSKNHSQFVMHDLVGDLSRWAAGDMCFRLEDKLDVRCSSKVRHSSYIPGQFDGVQKFKEFFEVRHLRTFLPLSLSGRSNYLTRNVTFDLLPKLKYLRALSFNGYQITELPNSIGKLKHLRYLDLSHTQITTLPESTSNLYNLQTLILENCACLKTLPADMRNLTDLRHLNNSVVPSLEEMPVKLGRLTNLQTLSTFVLGKGSKSGISEIGPLLCLQGTLCLSRLENVSDVDDARRADLTGKEGIDSLQLEWRESGERESDVFEMLKPHRKLKVLTVKGYGGLTFSTWTGHPSFSYMTHVKLEHCKNCRFLPPLGQLSSLKELCIKGMSTVESVGLEFYGESSLPFPVLETLEFKDMQKWREWLPRVQDQGIEVFPCLKMVCISGCPILEGRLPENLDLLSKLAIDRCGQLVVSIASYKRLRDLKIHACKMLVHTSGVQFELPEVMELSCISEFRLHMDGFKRDLTKLKNLRITSCEELTSLWKNEDRLLQRPIYEGNSSHSYFVQELKSLQCLHINDCSNLVSFSKVSLPPSLKEIKIERCSSLIRYQIPPNVRSLYIDSCINLESLVGEDKEGEDPSSSFSPCLIQEEASCLEYLSIVNCLSLTTLSSTGQLARGLKHLIISHCHQLESITDSFHVNTFLEEIVIRSCGNLKSLPEGLCDLTNLQVFKIWDCESLVSFPRGGLPTRTSSLKEIEVMNCDNLEALPKDMQNLHCLQSLRISYCDGFAPFLDKGLPSNLTFLEIRNLNSCRPLLEAQGLHRLTSLRALDIRGNDSQLVSFPPDKEMVLPKSLILLHIAGFPNLRHLSSKGFQFLPSLESLQVFSCPKLASIPEEGLPLSLTQLHIFGCPLLVKNCRPGKGQYWHSIARIPFIWIKGDKGEDIFRS